MGDVMDDFDELVDGLEAQMFAEQATDYLDNRLLANLGLTQLARDMSHRPRMTMQELAKKLYHETREDKRSNLCVALAAALMRLYDQGEAEAT